MNKKLNKLKVVKPIKHSGRISLESSNIFGLLTCFKDFNIVVPHKLLPAKPVATATTPSNAALKRAGTRLLIPV